MVKYESYKLKNGKKQWGYSGYFGIDPKTGRDIQLRKKAFNTKSEAKLHYERTVEELKQNRTLKRTKRIKFEQLYKEYLPYYRQTGVTEGTVIKFKLETKKHVLPLIGHMYIDEMTIDDCQKLVDAIRKKRKDFRKIIGHVRSMFKYAISKDYLRESPLDKVIIRPGKVSYEQKRVPAKENFYTTEQMMTFLEFYEDNGKFHEFVYFRLLAFTGLRRGEALALLKSDLSIQNKSLNISKTLTEGEYINTIVSDFTKTGDSESEAYELFLDDYTFKVIKEHVDESLYYNNKNKEVHLPSSTYMFTSPKSDSHYHRSAPNDWLKRFWKKNKTALEKLGLHYISPHGFRHSQATMLYELEVDPKDAQHRLRHKNIKTTHDIYTHVSENRERLTANRLNKVKSNHARNTARIINMNDYLA